MRCNKDYGIYIKNLQSNILQKNITIISPSQCTGCLSCVYTCPIKCISINKDKEGFLICQVDSKKCLMCGKCLIVCPVADKSQLNNPLTAYAAQRRNANALKKSSSGGIASVISENILSSDGIVYGAIMDSDMVVRHHRITLLSDSNLFCGSKYVQSDFSEVYKYIINDCESGKPVAVIGTPCQIAGVKKFLTKDYKNLVLIDLICHGAPSPALFAKYLNWKATKLKDGPIIKYRFRDKELYGWDTVYKVQTLHKEISDIATKDPYYFAFIYSQIYRESCYQCRFANSNRSGDITIGDFWGIEKEHPEFQSKLNKGVSAVICSTPKGIKVLEELKDDINMIESSIDKISRKNANLVKPAKRPAIRNVFYNKIKVEGFDWAQKKMLLDKRYYIEIVKRKVPIKLKNMIKKHIL